eukprot:TRINITY_DN10464_c1_g2_i1.p1 TRINITY_DN10464_c1_g2~~TRINITY_DN10464_c1_g2_i1.p1  ORF type:complete len:209 (+),score=21.93 TRINITY_DN10464_c1_g2_i1:51-629(+)
MGLTQRFLDSIFQCEKLIPQQFREICESIYLNVVKRFPDSGIRAIGGFIFLRYICPAIVSPTTFGLVKVDGTEQAKRALTLVAKVVQNMSNEVKFGAKEKSLFFMNTFIDEYQPKFRAFLQRICESRKDSPAVKIPVAAKVRQKALSKLMETLQQFTPQLTSTAKSRGEGQLAEEIEEILKIAPGTAESISS